MKQFKDNLLQEIDGYFEGMAELLPKLMIALILILFFWLISKYLLKILKMALSYRLQDKLVLRFIVKTARIILTGIGVLIFLKVIGFGTLAAGLWGTAGLGAFILGFAFKDIGEHFLAGFILAFNRPFRVGDTVETSGHLGIVTGLNLRETHIKSFDGKDVYIPNGNVIKNPLVNFTIDGFIRKDFVIGIDYGQDVDKAIDVILSVLKKHPHVLNETKQPSVSINKIASSALELKALYWLDTFEKDVNGVIVERELIRDCLNALEQDGFYLPGDVVEIRNYKNKS